MGEVEGIGGFADALKEAGDEGVEPAFRQYRAGKGGGGGEAPDQGAVPDAVCGEQGEAEQAGGT